MQGNQIFSAKRVVLIGFRAAGKSSLAEPLAARLGVQSLSTDALVERRLGVSIGEFVRARGWEEFRRIESEVVVALPSANVVIDCGGGVVESEENMRRLTSNALVVWVDADFADIAKRLEAADNAHRPLLSGATMLADAEANYARRRPMYESWSAFRADSSRLSSEEIVERIALLLEDKGSTENTSSKPPQR